MTRIFCIIKKSSAMFLLFFFSVHLFAETDGEILFKQNNPKAAIPVLESEISSGKASSNAYNYLGLCYYQIGDYKKSVESFQKGLSVQGTDKKILAFNAGNSCFAMKNYEKAVEYFSIAISEDSGFSSAFLNRANSYLMNSQYEETIADFNRFIELEPNNPQVSKIKELINRLNSEISWKAEEKNSLLEEEPKPQDNDKPKIPLEKLSFDETMIEDMKSPEKKEIQYERIFDDGLNDLADFELPNKKAGNKTDDSLIEDSPLANNEIPVEIISKDEIVILDDLDEIKNVEKKPLSKESDKEIHSERIVEEMLPVVEEKPVEIKTEEKNEEKIHSEQIFEEELSVMEEKPVEIKTEEKIEEKVHSEQIFEEALPVVEERPVEKKTEKISSPEQPSENKNTDSNTNDEVNVSIVIDNADKVDEILIEKKDEEDYEILKDGDILKIKVPEIFFDPNAATFGKLTKEQVKNNEEILDFVVGVLNDYPDYKVSVEGHANNVSGTEREEVEELIPLSQARAEAVVKILLGKGIDAGRLTAIGMGGRKPIGSGKDAWKNRRVEFILSK